MERLIAFRTYDPSIPQIFTVNVPDACPLCGTSAHFQEVSANIVYDETGQYSRSWTVTFSCPHCCGVFHVDQSFNRDILICPSFGKCDLPKEVLDEYPDFSSLYQQSLTAEAYGLTDIAGMGFRKSVEFLIKEYAVRHFPDDKERILSEPLSQTIYRVQSPQIQALAKAASWIGNDQTHILTKHPDYGIADMKKFILALSHFIAMEQYAADAMEFINPTQYLS